MGHSFKSGARSQGFPTYRNLAQDETATLVANVEANIFAFFLENDAAASVYLHIFDAASAGAVTPGVTVPDEVIEIPPKGKAVFDAIQVFFHADNGLVVLATDSASPSANAPASPPRVRIYHAK